MRFLFYFLMLAALPALADQAAEGPAQSGGAPARGTTEATPPAVKEMPAAPPQDAGTNNTESPGAAGSATMQLDSRLSTLGLPADTAKEIPPPSVNKAPKNVRVPKAGIGNKGPSSKLDTKLPAISVPPVANNADFAAAHDAYLAGNAARLEHYARRLKNSPMEVYAKYYQLRLSLEKADPAAVNEFLSRPEDTPLIDMLRVEWLKVLGNKQQWDLFDVEYPRLINEDTELTCYALQSRSRNQELAALRQARELWFTGKGQPESCGPLFDAALSKGIISRLEIGQRLRLSLEQNNITLATRLAELLENAYPGISAALKSAAADPDRYTEKLTPLNASEGKRIITLFALQRLAKQNTDLAAERWAKIEADYPLAEQHYFYGRLAYEAARNHDARALKWYRAAAYTPLDEKQAAWRVRAALRAQDWPEVLAGVNAMAEPQRRESAWLYWKARALQALGKVDEAREIFAPLSAEYSFYGQLASEELTDAPVLSEAKPAYKPDQFAIDAVSALPGVQRTMILYKVGLRNEALDEWRWVLRNLNDRELLTAAEIARRNKMYDRAIGAAEKTVYLHDFSMRFLAPYRSDLQVHVRKHGLDEAWVYGLMRQESRFTPSAKSEVGAAGLMQIMPSTARWAANRLGIKSYRKSLIHQLDTNLRLGTYYMKTILAQSGNNPVLASASYNAGPSRAFQWRGDQPLEGAIYTETIPFEETRDYVKKVMSNTVYYADQFGDPPRSLKQRLGVVPAKPANHQQAESDVP